MTPGSGWRRHAAHRQQGPCRLPPALRLSEGSGVALRMCLQFATIEEEPQRWAAGRALSRIERVVELRVDELQVRSAGDGPVYRMAATVVGNAELGSFRRDADGGGVASLKLGQRVQHEGTHGAGCEVARILCCCGDHGYQSKMESGDGGSAKPEAPTRGGGERRRPLGSTLELRIGHGSAPRPHDITFGAWSRPSPGSASGGARRRVR
jgi:hypothetical protein